MISGKYLKDYRLEEQIDSSGRARTKAVYIGGDYGLSPVFSKNEKLIFLLMSLLSCVSLIIALIPHSQAARTTYVILPFVFSSLPLFIMSASAFSLFKAKDIMKREQAQRIANRLPAGALTTAILNGAAFTAQIITLSLQPDLIQPGDISFSFLSLIITALATFILIKTRSIKAIN